MQDVVSKWEVPLVPLVQLLCGGCNSLSACERPLLQVHFQRQDILQAGTAIVFSARETWNFNMWHLQLLDEFLGPVSGEMEKGLELGRAIYTLGYTAGHSTPRSRCAGTRTCHLKTHFYPLWRSHKNRELAVWITALLAPSPITKQQQSRWGEGLQRGHEERSGGPTVMEVTTRGCSPEGQTSRPGWMWLKTTGHICTTEEL